jgi:hypothetical protein
MNIHSAKKMIGAACLSGVVQSALAAPEQIECPSELPMPLIKIVNTPGWKPFIQFSFYLSAAGISSGPPELRATLKGEPLNKMGQLESTRYRFGDMGFDQGKWLVCSYGEGTQILLSKRLDDSLKECTVSYLKQDRSDKQNIKIICK